MYTDIINYMAFWGNLETLPFVERYGGLVRTATKTVCVNEQYDVFKKVSFPVTCNADPATCYENEGHNDIIPDAQFKSIFYFEKLSEMKYNKQESEKLPKGGKSHFVYDGRVRLVGWLNMGALGKDVCDSCDFAVRCLLGSGMFSIKNKKKDFGTLTISAPDIMIDKPEIFKEYSYYNDIVEYLFYPYCAFAMDFNVQLLIGPDCTGTSDHCNDFGEPIECITV